MSNFSAPAYNPKTKQVETAMWIDNHFGPHKYGISFAEDTEVYRQEEVGVEAAGKEIDSLRALLMDRKPI